MVPPTV